MNAWDNYSVMPYKIKKRNSSTLEFLVFIFLRRG